MIRKVFIAILTLCGMLGSATAAGQDVNNIIPVDTALRQQIVDTVTAGYTDWDTMSISGKLSSPMLPITATVKVYMEKDELVVITVSAILVGEAARIEIDREQAVIINKLKGTYTTVLTEDIEPMLPGGLTAIQNMLLGRITLLGEGTLTPALADRLQIYDAGEGGWMLLPEQDIENSPFVYFYTVDPLSYLLKRFAVLAQSGEAEADAYYTWSGSNTTVDLVAVMGEKKMEASLRLNKPDMVTKKIQRMEDIDSRYRRTDLKGLLK